MDNVLTQDNEKLIIAQMLISTVKIWPNTGQIPGLPKNPRYMEEKGGNDLRNSIAEDPEYLNARPLIVLPYAGEYVVICGNMRHKFCIELHILEVPCIVLNPKTPLAKLKRYLLKDNISYGKNDWDMIANEWELEGVEGVLHWGLELPYMGEPETENDEGSVAIEKLKVTLDCDDKQAYDKLMLMLGPVLEKCKGVEMR